MLNKCVEKEYILTYIQWKGNNAQEIMDFLNENDISIYFSIYKMESNYGKLYIYFDDVVKIPSILKKSDYLICGSDSYSRPIFVISEDNFNENYQILNKIEDKWND